MAETTGISSGLQAAVEAEQDKRKAGWLAAGGNLGAIAASSCCILPLVLFSLGVGGAWMGNLTALAAYQPIFIGITALCLAVGFWLVYFKPAPCAEDDACARPLPNRVVKVGLWSATALVVLALAWPLIVPLILD
ncbi:MAG: mercuric transporter MerT family protein [Paracoccaceae bacterium]